MREIIQIETHRREVLVDITPQVESVVQHSGIRNGLVSVNAQGATAAILPLPSLQAGGANQVFLDFAHRGFG